MPGRKENLRRLLNEAISEPSAEIVNYRALRRFLEASIESGSASPRGDTSPNHPSDNDENTSTDKKTQGRSDEKTAKKHDEKSDRIEGSSSKTNSAKQVPPQKTVDSTCEELVQQVINQFDALDKFSESGRPLSEIPEMLLSPTSDTVIIREVLFSNSNSFTSLPSQRSNESKKVEGVQQLEKVDELKELKESDDECKESLVLKVSHSPDESGVEATAVASEDASMDIPYSVDASKGVSDASQIVISAKMDQPAKKDAPGATKGEVLSKSEAIKSDTKSKDNFSKGVSTKETEKSSKPDIKPSSAKSKGESTQSENKRSIDKSKKVDKISSSTKSKDEPVKEPLKLELKLRSTDDKAISKIKTPLKMDRMKSQLPSVEEKSTESDSKAADKSANVRKKKEKPRSKSETPRSVQDVPKGKSRSKSATGSGSVRKDKKSVDTRRKASSSGTDEKTSDLNESSGGEVDESVINLMSSDDQEDTKRSDDEKRSEQAESELRSKPNLQLQERSLTKDEVQSRARPVSKGKSRATSSSDGRSQSRGRSKQSIKRSSSARERKRSSSKGKLKTKGGKSIGDSSRENLAKPRSRSLNQEVETAQRQPSKSPGRAKENLLKTTSNAPDSILKQINVMAKDTSQQINQISGRVSKLESNLQTQTKKTQDSFDKMHEKISKEQKKTRDEIERVKSNVQRSEVGQIKSLVRKELSEVIDGSEFKQKSQIVFPKPSPFVENCKCNALKNNHICLCRLPMNCNKSKRTSKYGGIPPICFCSCSYIRGTDGITYHTLCNCCHSLTNLTSYSNQNE